jgi:NTP pyrophosphatase (non-canonical NTP hydrolase)
MNIYEDMKNMERNEEQKELQSDIVAMIAHWSSVFELPISEKREIPAKERETLAFSLIEEEFVEYQEALENSDLRGIQDSLGDLLWVIVRAMMEYGIDPLKTIRAIYISNMSKLDTSYEDLMESILKYTDEGINVYPKNLSNGYYSVRRLSDNKILKSYKFKEPNFDF